MTQHIKNIVLKAGKVVTALECIVNIGGHQASKRKILMYAAYSALLYATQIWKKPLKQ